MHSCILFRACVICIEIIVCWQKCVNKFCLRFCQSYWPVAAILESFCVSTHASRWLEITQLQQIYEARNLCNGVWGRRVRKGLKHNPRLIFIRCPPCNCTNWRVYKFTTLLTAREFDCFFDQSLGSAKHLLGSSEQSLPSSAQPVASHDYLFIQFFKRFLNQSLESILSLLAVTVGLIIPYQYIPQYVMCWLTQFLLTI